MATQPQSSNHHAENILAPQQRIPRKVASSKHGPNFKADGHKEHNGKPKAETREEATQNSANEGRDAFEFAELDNTNTLGDFNSQPAATAATSDTSGAGVAAALVGGLLVLGATRSGGSDGHNTLAASSSSVVAAGAAVAGIAPTAAPAATGPAAAAVSEHATATNTAAPESVATVGAAAVTPAAPAIAEHDPDAGATVTTRTATEPVTAGVDEHPTVASATTPEPAKDAPAVASAEPIPAESDTTTAAAPTATEVVATAAEEHTAVTSATAPESATVSPAVAPSEHTPAEPGTTVVVTATTPEPLVPPAASNTSSTASTSAPHAAASSSCDLILEELYDQLGFPDKPPIDTEDHSCNLANMYKLLEMDEEPGSNCDSTKFYDSFQDKDDPHPEHHQDSSCEVKDVVMGMASTNAHGCDLEHLYENMGLHEEPGSNCDLTKLHTFLQSIHVTEAPSATTASVAGEATSSSHHAGRQSRALHGTDSPAQDEEWFGSSLDDSTASASTIQIPDGDVKAAHPAVPSYLHHDHSHDHLQTGSWNPNTWDHPFMI